MYKNNIDAAVVEHHNQYVLILQTVALSRACMNYMPLLYKYLSNYSRDVHLVPVLLHLPPLLLVQEGRLVQLSRGIPVGLDCQDNHEAQMDLDLLLALGLP